MTKGRIIPNVPIVARRRAIREVVRQGRDGLTYTLSVEDDLTPQEAEVIERADKWLGDAPWEGDRDNPSTHLAAAVRALRESRKPKPRYRVQCGHNLCIIWDDLPPSTMVANSMTSERARQICDMLNAAASERGEP